MSQASPHSRAYPCEKCPLRANQAFRSFEPEELAFVENFKIGELVAEAGSTILSQGANSAHIYTVLKGWAFRYKMLEDGRRQILNFALPGDLIGLQGALLHEMGHSVGALTDMTLCVFERERLWDLFLKFPSLSFDITWLAAREESLLDEQLVSLGRRSALERMAYVLLLLHDRAVSSGAEQESAVIFPFTQQHLADMLGLSLVHTNKTLRKLTDRELIRWNYRAFAILDREALAGLANYENQERTPRPFL